MAITPTPQPAANASKTMITIGACHCTPKNQWMVAACWLFSAKAKSAKKMKPRRSQVKARMRG
jgi:hypothetical protein